MAETERKRRIKKKLMKRESKQRWNAGRTNFLWSKLEKIYVEMFHLSGNKRAFAQPYASISSISTSPITNVHQKFDAMTLFFILQAIFSGNDSNQQQIHQRKRQTVYFLFTFVFYEFYTYEIHPLQIHFHHNKMCSFAIWVSCIAWKLCNTIRANSFLIAKWWTFNPHVNTKRNYYFSLCFGQKIGLKFSSKFLRCNEWMRKRQ